MSSRDKVLSAVLKNQPGYVPYPIINLPKMPGSDRVAEFSKIALAIGSRIFQVNGFAEVTEHVKHEYGPKDRIFSNIPQLSAVAEKNSRLYQVPHTFENVELTILNAQFAVAENGALWLTEENMGQRILPFICQHLALIVNRENILPDMHSAYAKIGNNPYGYGAFIAGPSKTADIEQSLVLGAHGPRTLTVYIIDSEK
jgi:L-lactate dehydrogenase complex protein LldG